MEETIPNPISSKVRGWLFVANIVLQPLSISLGVLFTIIGLVEWLPLLVSLSGALGTIAGTLGRGNLSQTKAEAAAKAAEKKTEVVEELPAPPQSFAG